MNFYFVVNDGITLLVAVGVGAVMVKELHSHLPLPERNTCRRLATVQAHAGRTPGARAESFECRCPAGWELDEGGGQPGLFS